MAVIDIVLSNIIVLLIAYGLYRNYSNDGPVKEFIDGFTRWIETGKLK